MDEFGPPKAGFSRSLDVVMLHLWSTRPRREACLASKRENPVKWVNSQFIWYYAPQAIKSPAVRTVSQSAHCLIKIGNDVGYVLDPDGQAHHVGTGTGFFQLFRREL